MDAKPLKDIIDKRAPIKPLENIDKEHALQKRLAYDEGFTQGHEEGFTRGYKCAIDEVLRKLEDGFISERELKFLID